MFQQGACRPLADVIKSTSNDLDGCTVPEWCSLQCPYVVASDDDHAVTYVSHAFACGVKLQSGVLDSI